MIFLSHLRSVYFNVDSEWNEQKKKQSIACTRVSRWAYNLQSYCCDICQRCRRTSQAAVAAAHMAVSTFFVPVNKVWWWEGYHGTVSGTVFCWKLSVFVWKLY